MFQTVLYGCLASILRSPAQSHATIVSSSDSAMTADEQADTESSSVIRLRGLPFTAQQEDVRSFFGDVTEVTEVYFCGRDGEQRGQCEVVEGGR
jgi:hypothetical protein